MINPEDVHIIIPAWNEAAVIGAVISKIKSAGFNDIAIINDGSTDKTAEVASSHNVIVKSHPINRGAGAASQTAISLAKKKNWSHIAFIDADGQHNPNDIHLLIDEMNNSACDIVIGNRFGDITSAIPKSRIFYNGIANKMTNIFCRHSYQDSQSGLRLLNRNAIEKLDLRVDGFGFCSEMIIVAEYHKLKISETPINVLYSDYSVSKGQGFFTGVSTAFHFIWNIIFK